MDNYPLYKLLKEKGFPQGGSGSWIQDPETNEKVYVPQPSEIYNSFIGDPVAWQNLSDVMAQAWIDNEPR